MEHGWMEILPFLIKVILNAEKDVYLLKDFWRLKQLMSGLEMILQQRVVMLSVDITGPTVKLGIFSLPS